MAISPTRKSTSTYHIPPETPSGDSRHSRHITDDEQRKDEKTPLFDGRKSDATEGKKTLQKGKSLAGTSTTPSDQKSNEEEKGTSEGKKPPEKGETIPHLTSPEIEMFVITDEQTSTHNNTPLIPQPTSLEITEEETSTHNNTLAAPRTPTHVAAVNTAAERAQQATGAATEAQSCIDEARKASEKALNYAQHIRLNSGTAMQTVRAAADAARIAAEAVRATVTYAEEVAMASSAATLAHGIAAAATNTNDASAAALQANRATKTATDAARLAQAHLQVALSASQAEENDIELKWEKACRKNMPNILALMAVIVAIEFALKEPTDRREWQWWMFCYALTFLSTVITTIALSGMYNAVSEIVPPRHVEKLIVLSCVISMINCLARLILLFPTAWLLLIIVAWCVLCGMAYIFFVKVVTPFVS